jgi:serine protease Do
VAGIEPGDVLVATEGRTLRTFLDWEAAKLDVSPGDTLTVDLRRGNRQRQVRLAVADLPTARAEKVDVLGDLQLITLSPAIRQERGIASEQGALIYQIGAATQRATGLRVGDVILQINRRRVSGAEDVEAIVRQVAGRGAIRVYFERDGSLGYTDFYVR